MPPSFGKRIGDLAPGTSVASGDEFEVSLSGSSGSRRITLAILLASLAAIFGYFALQPLEDPTKVVSKLYPFGNVHRYGAVGDGVTNDTAAFQATLDVIGGVGGGRLVCSSGKTYVIASAVTAPSTAGNVVIDLSGATIKYTGGTQIITRDAQAVSVTATVSSGATLGSTAVVVAGATGLAAGQMVRFTSTTGTGSPSWLTIKSIVGTTINLSGPLTCTYGGTITLNVQPLFGSILVVGGVIDLSGMGGASVGLINLNGYLSAEVTRVVFSGSNGLTTIGAVVLGTCVSADIHECRAINTVFFSAAFEITQCGSARIANNTVDGDGFGIAVFASDREVQTGNILRGRWSTSGTGYSVRCIKSAGNGHSVIQGNQGTDYTTLIKYEDSRRGSITGNVGFFIDHGGSGDAGIQATASTTDGDARHVVISGNVIDGSGGYGINATNDGDFVITNNVIRNTVGGGIRCTVPNAIIAHNRISDWDTGIAGFFAIEATAASGAYQIVHNQFSNVSATPTCISDAGGATVFEFDNVVLTANPMGGSNTYVPYQFPNGISGIRSATKTAVGFVGEQPFAAAFLVNNGQSFTFSASAFGMLFVIALTGSGAAGLFLADGAGNVTVIADGSSTFVASASPASGKIGVSVSAKVITVHNNSGGQIRPTIALLGTSATAVTDPA